jgi:hypothetical protein
MTTQFQLSKSQIFENGYFNAILDCGFTHNWWLKRALKYLPEGLFDKNTEGFLFTSTANRDACRIARHYCQSREIILISERILPGKNVVNETDPKARYFIYVVLHEVAHAVRKHKSPELDNLTKDEIEAQEKEADELAMSWFNDHVTERKNEHLLPIKKQEIEATQYKNKELMKKMKAGI